MSDYSRICESQHVQAAREDSLAHVSEEQRGSYKKCEQCVRLRGTVTAAALSHVSQTCR